MEAGPPPAPINPYAAPQTPADQASEAGRTAAHDLTRDEVRAFVGRNSPYYWRNWQRAVSGSNRAGFNWAACLFSFGWALYRKMYREAFIGIGIIFGLGIFQGIVSVVTNQNLGAIDSFEDIAVAIMMGMYGNGLYLRRARLIIADARAREPDTERREALLRSRGGTSLLGILIAVVITAAFAAIASMAAG